MAVCENFCYHGSRCHLGSSLNKTKSSDSWNFQFGACLLYRLSYSQFCVCIPKILLPWQRVCRRQVVMTPLNWHTPKTPLVKNLGIVCYGNQFIASMAVRGPHCGVWWKWFSLVVNPAPYIIWYRKRMIVSAYRQWLKGVTSQNCNVLWPNGLKENFTDSHFPLL